MLMLPTSSLLEDWPIKNPNSQEKAICYLLINHKQYFPLLIVVCFVSLVTAFCSMLFNHCAREDKCTLS